MTTIIFTLLGLTVLLGLLGYFVHRRHWHNLHLLWAGLACYVGWVLLLTFVPGGEHMNWPWLILDAPLNAGWLLFLTWPLLWENVKRFRDKHRSSGAVKL